MRSSKTKPEKIALLTGFKGQHEPIKARPSDPTTYPGIEIKIGVVFKVLRPEIYMIFPVIAKVFGDIHKPCFITSANDSELHKSDSYHYVNLAIDIRSKHLNNLDQKLSILQALKTALLNISDKYLILFEHEGSDREHFHIQFSGNRTSV